MKAWDIFVNDSNNMPRYISTVYYSIYVDADEVKKFEMSSTGYSDAIYVVEAE